MANVLEEKLREASCLGDIEAVERLLARNVDVNSQNPVNGWTALHWACKRGNENVVRLLLENGADGRVKNSKDETASDICTYKDIVKLLVGTDELEDRTIASSSGYVPNYIRNAPLNGKVDLGPTTKVKRQPELFSMPNTVLPSAPIDVDDELVLKVRIHDSPDPDFIEIEIPKWKLTYSTLLKICCAELEIPESRVERIRKLPNTRLRKDKDIKRLTDFQPIELVLKKSEGCDKSGNNCYQSISTYKDQTVLY